MKQSSQIKTFFWTNTSPKRKVIIIFTLEEEKDVNKSAKRIRKLTFENFKYADFVIANELWRKYITQLIDPKYISINQDLLTSLIRIWTEFTKSS
jgi:superfamily I DNA/RNA helicase